MTMSKKNEKKEEKKMEEQPKIKEQNDAEWCNWQHSRL